MEKLIAPLKNPATLRGQRARAQCRGFGFVTEPLHLDSGFGVYYTIFYISTIHGFAVKRVAEAACRAAAWVWDRGFRVSLRVQEHIGV